MPTVEGEDIRPAVSNALGRDAIKFIEMAAALGWTVKVANGGSNVTLFPYERYDIPSRRIHLSARGKGRNSDAALKKRHRNLARFSILMAMKEDGKVDDDQADKLTIDMIVRGMRDDQLSAILRDTGLQNLNDNPETLVAVKPEAKRQRQQKTEDNRTFTTSGRTVPTSAEVAARQKTERHIISERPAKMHAGTGRGYPSRTTIERRWSDGTVDYACAHPTCGEVSTNRRSFGGAHWGMHVRKGEAEPVSENRTEFKDPGYVGTQQDHRQGVRLGKLKTLLEGIDLKSISVDDLAEQIDDYLRGTPSASSEPLTADEMIDRIRRIVDSGHYYEQEQRIIDLSQQLDDAVEYADQQIANLEEQVSAETARANTAVERWNALCALIQDEQPQMRFETG